MLLKKNDTSGEPDEKISSVHIRLASMGPMTAMVCHIAIVPNASWHSSPTPGIGN
jgi:hypothetical protein